MGYIMADEELIYYLALISPTRRLRSRKAQRLDSDMELVSIQTRSCPQVSKPAGLMPPFSRILYV